MIALFLFSFPIQEGTGDHIHSWLNAKQFRVSAFQLANPPVGGELRCLYGTSAPCEGWQPRSFFAVSDNSVLC
jgi:hypothetical protein